MPTAAARLTAMPRPDRPDVEEAVLPSKITPPHLPGCLVGRARITKLISAGTSRPVTVLTGPPGAGKTVAVASWAADQAGPIRVAWLSVDSYDNQPGSFWRHLVAALRQAAVPAPPAPSSIGPVAGTAVPAGTEALPGGTTLPAGTVDPASHRFLLRLAAVLAAQDPSVVLVLDDIHLLVNRQLLDGLAYLLRHASGGLHLVIGSRTQPRLPLHRFRLTGELTEIGPTDLAFTAPETGQLLARHGLRLAPAAVEALTSQVEGWAAGLRLAALSLRDRPNPDQLAAEFSVADSMIPGYLQDEVLNAQPASHQDLLLKTSIVDRISADLAGELTGDRQTAAALPALAEANPFIVPLGHGWYRYHSVFAEFLRLKLRRQPRGDVAELHRRAARWFRRHGRLADAVSAAAAAADWELAARSVIDELAAGHLADPWTAGPVADQFRRMPPGQRPAHPAPLLAAAAVAVRDRRAETAGALLRTADALLDRWPAGQEIASRFAAAQIRLAQARRNGDLGGAQAAVGTAAGLLANVPADELATRPLARAQLLVDEAAVGLWQGRFEEASADLEEAAAVSESAASADGDPAGTAIRANCAGLRALVAAVRGQLDRAAAAAATLSQLAPGQARPAAEVALAWVHLERAQLPESRRHLARSQDALRASPDRLTAALACLVAARHSLAAGRPGAAVRLTGQARTGWSPPLWLDQRLARTESQAHVAAGDTRAALEAARRAGDEVGPAATARGRAWLAAGDLAAASQALAAGSAAGAVELGDADGVEACLVKAVIAYRSGDSAGGQRALEQALRRARRQQLRLVFWLERPWLEPVLRPDAGLAHLLRRLCEPVPGSPGVGRLASATPATATPRTPVSPAAPGRSGARRPAQGPPAIVVELSEREREVLQKAGGMLSTAEIADQLHVSVNTVKTHLRSSFRKLGANRRGEAVRWARELDLI